MFQSHTVSMTTTYTQYAQTSTEAELADIPEPYRSDVLPFWALKNAGLTTVSAEKIYLLFLRYKQLKDFSGMEIAKKLLYSGFVHLRQPTHKATHDRASLQGDQPLPFKIRLVPKLDYKNQAARFFFGKYMRARLDPLYLQLKDYAHSHSYSF